MIRLHKQHPHYKWNTNKGYGTAEHRAAIAEHGLCCYHRRSFNILSAQMELPFDDDAFEFENTSTTISPNTGNFHSEIA
jgi:ribonuclease HII